MIFRSFLDSDDYGSGPLTARLSFSATVNALDWYDLRVWCGDVEVKSRELSQRDMNAIREALDGAVAEKRREHMESCAWLRATFREAK